LKRPNQVDEGSHYVPYVVRDEVNHGRDDPQRSHRTVANTRVNAIVAISHLVSNVFAKDTVGR
jgi:hypothetical protein